MLRITVIGLAGAIGAFVRFQIGVYMEPLNGVFPYATCLINLIGSFFLSWFTVWSTRIARFPEWLHMGITTGFIGSFTTFSTFSVELIDLLSQQNWILAMVYGSISMFGGVLFAWLGYELALLQKYEDA
jgi:fluoride exporter